MKRRRSFLASAVRGEIEMQKQTRIVGIIAVIVVATVLMAEFIF